MFLKNYTSDVPASVTINRIQNVLLRAGVKSISMDYGPNQQIVAITFLIEHAANARPLAVRMPANVEQAHQALWLDYVGTDKLSNDGQTLWSSQKRKRRKDFAEQAEKTAWKLVQDWIEVQISMIQLQQADAVQVFLPYIWDGRRTFFQTLKDSGFKALMPPKEDPARVEVVS